MTARGYWIGNNDISDFEGMLRYRDANREVLTRYGAKFLMMGGKNQVTEGDPDQVRSNFTVGSSQLMTRPSSAGTALSIRRLPSCGMPPPKVAPFWCPATTARRALTYDTSDYGLTTEPGTDSRG